MVVVTAVVMAAAVMEVEGPEVAALIHKHLKFDRVLARDAHAPMHVVDETDGAAKLKR